MCLKWQELRSIGSIAAKHPWHPTKPQQTSHLWYCRTSHVFSPPACHRPTAAQASSEHSISVAIEASGAAAAKKITEEAFAMEIRSETIAVDVIR